jgi:hypothetical protein
VQKQVQSVVLCKKDTNNWCYVLFSLPAGAIAVSWCPRFTFLGVEKSPGRWSSPGNHSSSISLFMIKGLMVDRLPWTTGACWRTQFVMSPPAARTMMRTYLQTEYQWFSEILTTATTKNTLCYPAIWKTIVQYVWDIMVWKCYLVRIHNLLVLEPVGVSAEIIRRHKACTLCWVHAIWIL